MSAEPSTPAPSTRPRVRLKRVPSPHPFLRRSLIAERPVGLAEQEVIALDGPDGQPLGEGLWNERSDICIRRITTGEQVLDNAYLRAAVDRAVTWRAQAPGLLDGSDAWRAVHAEGDGLSGLIVDRYGDVLAVELHSVGWELLLDDLLPQLHARLGTQHHVVELPERVARLERVRAWRQASDGCPREVRVREHGVRFRVDLSTGHKTGFFCDQRDNRQRLAGLVDGKDVLDLCTHTGGFAVAAAVLGAPGSVTAVDLDEAALATARKNANLNQVRVGFTHADAFDWCRQVAGAGRDFDVVVLDPPKFVPSRKDAEEGLRKYVDLNRLALRVVRHGGRLLTCSCSGPVSRDDLLGIVRDAARKEGCRVRVEATTGAGVDHPVAAEFPEGEYLKALWLGVER